MDKKDEKIHHSDLQLVKHDASANAPERDRFAEAPELDQSATAPEGVRDSGPQVAYEDVPPIPVGERQEKEALAADRGKPSRSCVPTLFRKKWVIASLVLAAIVVITIGVAFGTTRKNSATPFQTTAPTAPPAATTVPPSSYEHRVVESTKLENNMTSIPTPLEHGVLDDSSFAAASAQDGSRYVFFQDDSGTLRQVYYSQTTLSWTSATSKIIPDTTDARRNTPLAAVSVSSPDDQILLFYISTNNSLSAKLSVSGGWDTSEAGNLIGFKAAPDSRSMSVNLISNTTTPELCIFFESDSGNVTALHGQTPLSSSLPNSNRSMPNGLYYPWTWQDISYNLYTSSPNTTFRPPFANALATVSVPESNDTSGNADAYHGYLYELCTGGNYSVATSGNCSKFIANGLSLDDVALQAVFYNPDMNGFSTPWYQNGSFHSLTPSILPSSIDPIPANVQSSDIVLPYFTNERSHRVLWVNATRLVSQYDSDFNGSPVSPYPYKRLAVITPPGSKAFYLYHQINASTLAEDIYDTSIGSWTSNNISIPTVRDGSTMSLG